ncbi:MAG: FecR domain-containing protein [Deltaproteobacteria bacterium]|nr:FecR domain-containing protein [Deltaproteobacteria bacterium]
MDSTKIIRIACAILIAVFLLLFSGPAISADKTVGHLTDFSGTVMVKSQGSWGVKIKTGLPLYSDDKVVTRAGTATVTFTDGAVMELKANSNLLIKEQEEEKGFFRKVKFTQRRLRLLVGKLIFKTGRASKTKTNFETATMVCGLRGTAGTAYIQFSDGGTSFTIGDLISGVAEDVPAEIANLNPAQVAAFIATAAADQAQKAAAMAQETAGTPEAQQAQAQAAYTAAQAALRTILIRHL